MNKTYTKRLSLVVLLCLSSLWLLTVVAGCGRLDVTVHTTVTPSGAIIQQLSYTGSGMIGGILTGSTNSADLQKQGWQSETRQSGDSITFTATKKFEHGNDLSIPSVAGNNPLIKGVKFNINNYVILRDYYLEATLIGTPATNLASSSSDWDKMGEAMANSMFSMAWTITLPGRIVATNADKAETDTATWYFNFSSLQKDRYMMVHTRYIDWLIIATIIVGIIVLAVVAVLLLKYSRRIRTQVS